LKPLGSAIHVAGSRLANEFHGGKAGRFLMVFRGNRWRPKRCKCGGAVAFDYNGLPHCSDCGHEPIKNAYRTQIERNDGYKRLRAAKKFRMYG
jgi:hypothetical protein